MPMKELKEPCTWCGGSGKMMCTVCDGTGKSFFPAVDPLDRVKQSKPCSFCRGTGHRTCMWCRGRGFTVSHYIEPESFHLDIPSVRPDLHIHTSMPPSQFWQPPSVDRWRTPGTLGTSSGGRYDSTVLTILLIEAAVLAILLAVTFTVEELLVAAEAFFIFAGWSAMRVASLSRKQESETLEKFRVGAAIGFGVSGGLLVAYLMLFTNQGQQLTQWVTAQHFRVIVSLFGTVFALTLLEIVWRRVFHSPTG